MMTVEFTEDGAFLTTFSSNPSLASEGKYRVLEENLIEVVTQTPEGNDQSVQMEYEIDGLKLTLSLGGESQVFYRLEE